MNPSTGLRISEAAQLLGVPAPTLRAWERRYGLPSTSTGTRSAGGHRRYSVEELHALRLMRDEITRGARAAAAARTVRATLDLDGPAAQYVASLLDSTGRRQPDQLQTCLDQAVMEFGIDATIDHVLMPMMKQIGSLWEAGRCDVGQEHLATAAVLNWLSRMTALAPKPTGREPIVLAAGPSDEHTLGLEAFALLLRHRGLACRTLGARVDLDALELTIHASAARVVVVVCYMATSRGRAVRALSAVDKPARQLFYAGNAFTSSRSRRGVPGRYLPPQLGIGADLVAEAASSGAATAQTMRAPMASSAEE